jgi:hypothetical protein
VEILAKDLLKIDRSGKKVKGLLMKETGSLNARQEAFFLHLERDVTKYEEDLVTLHSDSLQVAIMYKEVCIKYGEKPNCESEDLFGWVAEFLKRFEVAQFKFADDLEKARKEQSRAAAEEKNQADREARRAAKAAAAGTQELTAHDATPAKGNPFAKAVLSTPKPAAGGGDAAAAPPAKPNPFQKSGSAGGKKSNPFARPPAAAGATALKPAQPEASFDDNPFLQASPTTDAPASYNPFGATSRQQQLAAADADKPKPARTGTFKKFTTKGSRGPRWEVRFFEVGETGYLNWYSKEGAKISGSVFLQGCKLGPEEEGLSAADEHVLILSTETKTYRLCMASAEEMQAWLDAMVFYTVRSEA